MSFKQLSTFLLITCITVMVLTCKKEPPVAPPSPSVPDTTSQNFTWTQYPFAGPAGSSYFNDVAVVNDTDIWAVGVIFTTAEKPYNAVHWVGKKWDSLQIQFHAFCGQSVTGSYPITAIVAFSGNDVWFCDGGELVHWNGHSYESDCSIGSLTSGEIRKMWGSSASDMYLVGYNGTLIHYANGKGQKITSGTSLGIQDIWGGVNPTTGQEEILAVASNVAAIPQAKALLQISGNTVTAVNDSGLALALSSVWFIPGWKYFVGGDGLFSTTAMSSSWQVDTTQPLLYKDAIRGTGKNDIFVVGGYGLVSHWNGATWKQYTGNELQSFYGYYQAVSFVNNTVAAVGNMGGSTIDSYAVVLVGERK
jgi:hypothetical protein